MLIYRSIGFNLVFFYHYGVFHIGYIGVDVFFVISGYLISKSLSSISANHQSWYLVYVFLFNRLYRIMPALFLITSFVIIISYFIIPVADRAEVFKYSITSILGISNIYQIYAADYFNASAIFNPLTHLWSVSVELQFYLVAMIFVGFSPRYSFYLILIVTVCSLLLLVSTGAGSGYQSMFHRFYAFGIGYLLASKVETVSVFSWKRFVLGLVVLAFVYSVLTDVAGWRMYSLGASCITALLLYYKVAPEEMLPNVIVSPFELQGKLSYSLYLVHYPVISFAYWIYGPLGVEELLSVYVFTHLIGYFLYFGVESRFSYKANKRGAQ